MLYQGRCHCGAVTFTVDAPESLEVEDCNCSICAMTGFLHLIRPHAAFALLTGADFLIEYRFNTGVARHMFCRVCGVRPFYVPRSNPEGISVNPRCLIPAPASMRVVAFDGVNWEQNAHRLAHKSAD
jgi:hypothetical protein